MGISPGSSIGPFRVVEKIGEGGMGEVYRATDTKLGRDVAVKVLPEAYVADQARMARFEREARVLASLNHPNIAAIYGLEEAGDARALVLELVEGPTLAERMAGGAMSLDEVLPIARQIAEALEYAHGHGIVHRDLKPANVKIRPDGTTKVLDFGLARAMTGEAPRAADASLANSPTLTAGATEAGMILGTAGYMSPEQARGHAVDRRSDVWSFGVLLYEMLAGRSLFTGETVSDTLAAVLKTEPDWDRLPEVLPPRVTRALRRCLRKDPARRYRSAADAVLALDEAEAGADEPATTAAPAPTLRARAVQAIPWILVAILVAILAGMSVLRLMDHGAPPEASTSARLEIALPPAERVANMAPPRISPDGRLIVFGTGGNSVERLWLRSIDSFEAIPLPGTNGAELPFWSPDSRRIAYFVRGSLKKMDLANRTASTICDCADWGRGGSWGEEGTILFAPNTNAPIHRVPATGGEAVPVTQLDESIPDISHRFPLILPGGRHFLFTLWSNNAEAAARHGGIYVSSMDGGAPRRILPDASSSAWVPGHLLIHRNGLLVAVPFDTGRLEVTAEATPIAENVFVNASVGIMGASASRRGDIVFSSGWGNDEINLVWYDRGGAGTGVVYRKVAATDLVIAPDGRHYAATITGEGAGAEDIWVGDFERGTLSRLTRATNESYAPAWSPDASRVAFTNRDTGNEEIYVRRADGTAPPEHVYGAEDIDTRIDDWSRDGRYLLFESFSKVGRGLRHIWLYDFEEQEAKELLVDPGATLTDATVSPDGRWLAYVSDQSGRTEVYLRPFPSLDRRWQISREGGEAPHWSADGREIVFMGSDLSVRAVRIAPSPDGVEPGIPESLFTMARSVVAITPSPDHARFLAAVLPHNVIFEPIRVILDWPSSLPGGRVK